VLRRLTRSEPRVDSGAVRDAVVLAGEYSHPLWLVRRWLEQFGTQGTEDLLRWNNTRPRLVLQPARADLESLRVRLQAGGVEVEPAPYDAGRMVGSGRPERLPGYGDGEFVVQNPAQSLLARFADLPAGAAVYDACAAPGGKTIALGRLARIVVAGDVSPSRALRLKENLSRAGSGREHVIIADGRRPPVRPTNAVVMDVPCLGTGTIARHPDARWRMTLEALESLVRLQAELLDRSAAAVAPGGLMVYSTCSLEPEENQSQVERFLQAHPEFRREATSAVSPELLTPEGDLMVLPHRHGTDGAYAARLRRSA
jgi:16S rRNA (cytosine967-C5)-methyltransferase